MTQNEKAVIIIGENNNIFQSKDYDTYYFPINITELELKMEIADLAKFYSTLVYPVSWPPHLQKEKVII